MRRFPAEKIVIHGPSGFDAVTFERLNDMLRELKTENVNTATVYWEVPQIWEHEYIAIYGIPDDVAEYMFQHGMAHTWGKLTHGGKLMGFPVHECEGYSLRLTGGNKRYE